MEISTKKPKGIFTIEAPDFAKTKSKVAGRKKKSAPVVAERYRPVVATKRGEQADDHDPDNNKVRLFNLMERADKLGKLNLEVSFRFTTTLPFTPAFGAPSDRTGVEFEIIDDHDEMVIINVFPNSDDHTFENVKCMLTKVQARYDAEQEANRKRDATLRSLTEEQRAILGFFHWVDPESDSK